MENFPANTNGDREKRVTRIAQGKVLRKRRTIGRRFADTIVGENARGVVEYVALEIVLPAIKDMIAEAATSAVERLLFGDSRGSSRSRGGKRYLGSGPVNYSRYSSTPAREPSRFRDARQKLDDIILASRNEAEEVIDGLGNLIDNYESASVADLHEMLGITGSHTDENYGWVTARDMGVRHIPNVGYKLTLPAPVPLK